MRVASATFRLLALLSAAVSTQALAQDTRTAQVPAAATPSTSSPAAPASAPPAQASATPSGDAPTASQTAEEAFNTRVKTLEEQVTDLKEKIYRSKARLLLLQETVLGGEVSTGARAVIVHKNDMGKAFALETVAYQLDSAPIFSKVDLKEDLGRQGEFQVFDNRIVPGQHKVRVRLVYRGSGYGVFSYVDGYRFTVESTYDFNAEPGKLTRVLAVGYEQGDITTDLKDRPAVRYEVEVTRDTGPRPEAAPPSSSPATPPATTSTETN